MAIYRFKVSFEEYDEVHRIIEIKSTQTFLDFHNCIQESVKFDNKHAASFFVSDDYWRKNDEITLLEEDKDHDTKLMSATKIATHIDHPYQRFIYLYDKDVQWSFFIELIKIDAENSKANYPSCIKSTGTAPKQYKNIPTQTDTNLQDPILAALTGAAVSDLNSEDLDDELEDEAYQNADQEDDLGLDEGDLDFTPGEEGEESDEGDDSENEMEEEEHYGFDDESGEDKY